MVAMAVAEEVMVQMLYMPMALLILVAAVVVIFSTLLEVEPAAQAS
jgi:hypothetical protein